MTDLFSPRRPDGRAEWRVVYDLAADLPYGADLSFDRIAEALDTDDRSHVYRAVRNANRKLIEAGKPRVLGNVRGTGYRILRPDEYAPAALTIRKQARKRMTSALDLMRVAPVDEMTSTQRDWAHRVTMVLMDNERRLRSQEEWKKDAEERLAELERRAGIAPPVVIDAEEKEAGAA